MNRAAIFGTAQSFLMLLTSSRLSSRSQNCGGPLSTFFCGRIRMIQKSWQECRISYSHEAGEKQFLSTVLPDRQVRVGAHKDSFLDPYNDSDVSNSSCSQAQGAHFFLAFLMQLRGKLQVALLPILIGALVYSFLSIIAALRYLAIKPPPLK